MLRLLSSPKSMCSGLTRRDWLRIGVADRPISPKDLLATMYHLLGIDPRTMLTDRQGRPLPLVDGNVIHDALA